jgi:hypothetical protein
MADQLGDGVPGDPTGQMTLGRIKRDALVCLALGALASLWFRSLGITLGFIGGGVVAVVNFRWIEAGLDAAMGSPMSSKKRALAVVKFVLRYVLLGLAIYAIVATRIVDLKAFLAGLFIFVVSIMWEAFRSALTSFRSSKS